MTQANRTLLTLVGLLALGGGVGLYAWFGVMEHDRKADEKKDHDDRLFMPTQAGEKKADGGVVDADFVKVTVVAKGDTTVLERVAGKEWRLVSPVQAPADRVAIDAVVSQLQQSKFKHTIDETPDAEAVKKYGLDKPDFTIEAVAVIGEKKDQRTVKLEGGVENTYDGSIFMRRNGEAKVYAAEGGVKWALARSTFELRDKDAVGIEESKLKSFEVKGRNNAYTLSSDGKKNWKVHAERWAGMKAGVGQADFDGDPISITGLFGQLKQEKATSFPTDTAEARRAFEQATLEVNAVLEGEIRVRLRLILPEGDAGAGGQLLRETANGESVLANIPGTVLAQLDRLPTEFRDKRVMPFKKEEVAKIVFRLAGGTEVVAEKGNPDAGTADSWRIVSPRQGPAKNVKIASVLWTMGSIKQKSVVEEKAKDPGKWGIDSKSRVMTLFDGNGKELGKLEMGKEVPGTAGSSYLRGTRDEVVEADNSRLGDFPAAVEDLLDLPAFDAGR